MGMMYWQCLKGKWRPLILILQVLSGVSWALLYLVDALLYWSGYEGSLTNSGSSHCIRKSFLISSLYWRIHFKCSIEVNFQNIQPPNIIRGQHNIQYSLIFFKDKNFRFCCQGEWNVFEIVDVTYHTFEIAVLGLKSDCSELGVMAQTS